MQKPYKKRVQKTKNLNSCEKLALAVPLLPLTFSNSEPKTDRQTDHTESVENWNE